MPNYNQLIINSKTCSIVLTVPTATILQSIPLLTVNKFDFTDKQEGEIIHAIGQPYGIGNQSNGGSADGKFTLQMGELNALLALCGFSSATQIQGAQLSVAAFQGGFLRTYNAVNVNTESSAIDAKGKETLSTLDWMGLLSLSLG